MKILSILVLAILPLFTFAAHQTITTTASVTVEATKSVDLTTAGKWSIQFVQDDWVKLSHTLYPDKSDRTAAVITAQADFKTAANDYVTLALNGGFYSTKSKGAGLIRLAGSFSYVAMDFEDGLLCKIYVRQNNKEHALVLYSDLDDESTDATKARASMVTELANISTPASADSFYR